MRWTFNRWLRRKQGVWAAGSLLFVMLVLLSLGQRSGWWHSAKLFGTARLNGGPSATERAPELVQRVSLSRLGSEGNSDSYAPSISADGRFIAFLSSADNLLLNDDNEALDVFLYDRWQEEITRLSVNPQGIEANAPSMEPRISRNGHVVVFVSLANNLTLNDSNNVEDVFIYDRETGMVNMVSVDTAGVQGNGRSLQPAISADGQIIAFASLANNLVPDDTNEVSDIFVHDRHTGETQRITVSSEGQEGNGTSKHPSISDDGRYVAFQSKSSNLAPDDDNNMYDVFVHDRHTRQTKLVSHSIEGTAGNHESQQPSLSADGRYIAFESWASNLVEEEDSRFSDVFVADRATGQIELVSVNSKSEQANDLNGAAAISNNGRFVAFASRADNLSERDYNLQFDVYVRDRELQQTNLISLNMQGFAANGSSISPAMTTSGAYIVFDSVAGDLVPNDTNERVDVFIFDARGTVDSGHLIHLPFVVRH